MDWDKLKIFHNVALDLNISEEEIRKKMQECNEKATIEVS